MQEFFSGALFVAMYGVSYGMILFTIAIGLVITLGLMRVVNLAHGAFAAVGGYIAVTLLHKYGVHFALAVPLAVLACMALSLVIERVFYSYLYNVSELEQVQMTVGLGFVAIASLNFFFGPDPQPVRLPAFLAADVDLGVRKFPAYRMFLVGSGVVLMAALWWLFERTSFGARLRAAVDNRSMAQLVGINVRLLYTIAFSLGCGLAAFGAAVGYSALPLEPTYPFKYLTLVLIVVTLAGFRNIKASAGAALLVGVTETACRYLLPQAGSFAVYLLLLAIVVFRSRGTQTERSHALQGVSSTDLLAPVRFRAWDLGLLGLAVLTLFAFETRLSLGTQALTMILFALSLDLVLGFGGIVTLGHALFFGAGAYTAGLLTLSGMRSAVPGLLIAGLVAALLAALTGPIVVRLKGLPQIMATMALGVMGYEVANQASSITGGADGLYGIKVDPLLGLFEWKVYGHTAYLYALTVVVICFVLLRLLIASSFGVALQGIRENRQRMMLIGSPVTRHLVTAYAISGFLAGVAGALSAQTTKFVSLDGLAMSTSVDALVMLTLGGIGRLYGAVVGAPVYMVIQHMVAELNPYHWLFAIGALLIVVVRFGRGGLIGMGESLLRRIQAARAGRSPGGAAADATGNPAALLHRAGRSE